MVVLTGVSMADRSVNGCIVLAKVSCIEEPSSSLGAMDAGYPQVSHLDGSLLRNHLEMCRPTVLEEMPQPYRIHR